MLEVSANQEHLLSSIAEAAASLNCCESMLADFGRGREERKCYEYSRDQRSKEQGTSDISKEIY